MPYLPQLRQRAVNGEMITAFGGYNHNAKISEGEWYAEENISSAKYPLFAPRERRSVYRTDMIDPRGLIAKDAPAWIEGAKLYYNGYEVDGITLSTDADDMPKQMISMGAYLCIFPDAVYVNTANLADCGSMGATYASVEGAHISYAPCTAEGVIYEGIVISAEAPEEPENGAYWMDSSTSPHALKQYSASASMWVQVTTVYARIGAAGIGQRFAKYDGVTISGATLNAGAACRSQVEALNGSAVIYDRGDDYIVIVGLVDEACEQISGAVRVERAIPRMDYVCEANNRLWGCFYGMQGGKALNEIYACKLGDFKNWSCFMGISTDSYTASVGTDGAFTGCIAYGGYPLFFKENCIHKLFGSAPSNFQMTTTTCRGVQRGSWRSLVVVDEVLYYRSRSDVCAYDGSLPVDVSVQLGAEPYYEACAGAYGGQYYISMRDGNGAWSLFSYDTRRRIWHRQDDTHAIGFAAWGDSLYVLDAGRDRIFDANGKSGTPETDEIEWYAESGIIGYDMPDQKYVSRFNIRMHLPAGARCEMYIRYDSTGEWEHQGTIQGSGLNSFTIPVIPRRCDHFNIRLQGSGEIRIYSIAKLIEEGSDMT